MPKDKYKVWTDEIMSYSHKAEVEEMLRKIVDNEKDLLKTMNETQKAVKKILSSTIIVSRCRCCGKKLIVPSWKICQKCEKIETRKSQHRSYEKLKARKLLLKK